MPTLVIEKISKNKKILKIFHYARFDVGILKHAFKINIEKIVIKKNLL